VPKLTLPSGIAKVEPDAKSMKAKPITNPVAQRIINMSTERGPKKPRNVSMPLCEVISLAIVNQNLHA
jgi:hypothetical protein